MEFQNLFLLLSFSCQLDSYLFVIWLFIHMIVRPSAYDASFEGLPHQLDGSQTADRGYDG